METARESLYEDTIIPFVERFLQSFNNWLIPFFDKTGNYELVIDYDDIDAYEAKNQRKADRIATLADKKLISRNEAREKLGYEPVANGDEIMISSAEVPLSFDFSGVDDFEDELINDSKP
jgi:phage portal protein BeeE